MMQRVTAELDDLLAAGDPGVTRGRTKTKAGYTSSGDGTTRAQRRSTSANVVAEYGGRPEWVPANSKKVPLEAAGISEGWLAGTKGRATSASPHRRSTWSTRPVSDTCSDRLLHPRQSAAVTVTVAELQSHSDMQCMLRRSVAGEDA
jgi:hypothetical protein